MKKLFKGLTKDTFILTFTSLFSDIATEMLYPILPLFLTQVLAAPASIVGIIEGVATATQYIVQGLSGYIADRLQQRKSLAFFGYLFAACAKPLIGISAIWQEVLGARFLDRFATGIRSAPRDALIAASAEESYKGKAFGLEGIGDNFGAFIGPLIAALLLFSLHITMQTIFFLAFIPAVLSAILILFVKEHKQKEKIEKAQPFRTASFLHFQHFPTQYWKYLFITAVFGIGNSSNAFLILRAKQVGIPLLATISIYACFNLVAALSSFPAGNLSDIWGRKALLFISFIVFFVSYLGFGLSSNIFLIGLLFTLYGIFSGMYRAVGKAAATDFAPQNLRASAVGWFSTIVGLTGLIASIVAGQLWVSISPQSVFYFGAATALLGILSLFFAFPKS